MYTITVSYERGKDFTRSQVVQVIYTYADGREVMVEGNELLHHHFPIAEDMKDLIVYADDGSSTVSVKDIRAITIRDGLDDLL